MILSVDTVKDSPAELRAAAALILSLVEVREGVLSGAQKHPFPPPHQEHHAVLPETQSSPLNRVTDGANTPVELLTRTASELGASSQREAFDEDATPPPRSRRIADLLIEVAQENPRNDSPKRIISDKNEEPEAKPLVRRIPHGVQVY